MQSRVDRLNGKHEYIFPSNILLVQNSTALSIIISYKHFEAALETRGDRIGHPLKYT